MSENEIDELRRRFAREAMALMERKGEEVSRTRLAAVRRGAPPGG